MLRKLTGLSAATKDNRATGAGIYFKNYDITTDTPQTATTAGKILGATVGGGTFEAKPKYTEFKVDGIPGKVKGFDDIEAWDVSLIANLLEFTPANIAAALGAAQSASVTLGEKNYTKIEGKTNLESTDYMDNITFIGILQGYKDPVIIQVYNAMSVEGFSMDMKDGQDSVTKVKWEARFDMVNNEISATPPFAIFIPKAKV